MLSFKIFANNNSPEYCSFATMFSPVASANICGLLIFLISPYLNFPTRGNNLGSYLDMPWWNSVIFKIRTDIVFEAVGMLQTKKVDLLQKLLGKGVQLVLLVEVWNGFAKSSSLRLILHAICKTISIVHVFGQLHLMLV